MIPIFLKDIHYIWMTFRRYILFLVGLTIAGLIGLVVAGSMTSVEDDNPSSQFHKMGVLTELVPQRVLDNLSSNENIEIEYFDEIEPLREAIKQRDVRYGLLGASETSLVIGIQGRTAIGDLIQKEVLAPYFGEEQYSVSFESVQGDQPKRFQALMIWFAFIFLLNTGGKLCNILVWEERAKGYLEELIASPASRLDILVGKLFAVLASSAAFCVGVVSMLLIALVGAATVFILNNSFLLGLVSEGSATAGASAEPANAMDIAGSVVAFTDPWVVLLVIASSFLALLIATSVLVVVNFIVKQQATLRFVVTPLILLVYVTPWLVPFEVVSEMEFHWAFPVFNIYFTSVFASLHESAVTEWLAAMAVNGLTFSVVLAMAVYVLSRIQDWPAR
jgi:ABC-type Na+ efflux pump permease subunit